MQELRELLDSPIARLIVSAALLAILLVISYYIVTRFRDRMNEREATASEHLTKFRNLQQHGDLTDQEFRGIKGVLSEKMQDELRDADANE